MRLKWQRLTDEPDIRDVEARTESEVDGWVVEVPAQEFFGQDPLGVELRHRLEAPSRTAHGVINVAEYDHESWLARGNPSGQALVQAAAAVLDDLADRLRAGMLGPLAHELTRSAPERQFCTPSQWTGASWKMRQIEPDVRASRS
jgi:hypothetical protein